MMILLFCFLSGVFVCFLSGVVVQGAYNPGANSPPDYNCSGQREGAYAPITLKNGNGMRAQFIRYGATITHLFVLDANGHARDVVLGFDQGEQYCAQPSHPYFGATIGRVANRISGGQFELNGKVYNSQLNEPNDTLHGGWVGFDRKVWDVTKVTASSVTFSTVSLEGDMGFPGSLQISVTHTLTEANEWVLSYTVSTDADTVVAMTNHAYFNLNANVNGTETALEHVVHMPSARSFVEVDKALLPTGQLLPVSSPTNNYLDFTTPKTVGRDITRGTATPSGGYDNALCFDDALVVTVTSPLTGIVLSMTSDQPSVQLYTGNFLDGTIPRKASQQSAGATRYYQRYGSICLEAQHFPDAPNHPNFPSIVLKKGQTYTQTTKYAFSVSQS